MPFVIIPVGWFVACLENDPNSPSRTVYPGTYILKFWQGIVDFILRAVTIVLSALVFMLAVIFGFGAGGWIAFAAFYVAVEEIIAVIVRFINPGLIWRRPAIPLIFSIIYYVIALLMLFPGFVVQAVWGARYSLLRGGAGTVAAFTLFLMVMVGALLTYAVLWYVLKWYNRLEEVTDTQSAAYAADKDPEAGAGEGTTTDMAG